MLTRLTAGGAGSRMDIRQATTAYQAWLGRQMPLLAADLRLKHERMAQSAFAFLRATFYRWAQLWPEACPELTQAPPVLGVGDLHVENFGTWRDEEGRLAWGVNDFDEACVLPYPNDLVRLAVSALLAAQENHLSCEPADICKSILSGYTEGLKRGGRPFVLAEHHAWLRGLATSELRDPVRFWAKLGQWPRVDKAVPPKVKQLLKQALPEPGLDFRVVHRQAGLGSLGRRRFTAVAEWRGGLIAREAKELGPSAWTWQRQKPEPLLYEQVLRQAVRIADPFVSLRGPWLLRRLAPDCSRVELGTLPKTWDALKLLGAMGREVANIHLGTPAAVRPVLKDLSRRPGKWLRQAAEAMARATLRDWQDWARRARPGQTKG